MSLPFPAGTGQNGRWAWLTPGSKPCSKPGSVGRGSPGGGATPSTHVRGTQGQLRPQGTAWSDRHLGLRPRRSTPRP